MDPLSHLGHHCQVWPFRRRSDDRLQAKALPDDRLEGVFGQDSVGAVGGEDVAVGEVAHLVYNRTTAIGRNGGAKKGVPRPETKRVLLNSVAL